jgi:glutamate N-acetyltransferase / amino-acid N-acetyltransferase
VTKLPDGFRVHTANVGIKDTTTDFCVVAMDRPGVAAGLFTKSRFAGASVLVSREHLGGAVQHRAMVVVSKNANVATGEQGLADARELCAGVAAALGCTPDEVLVASTGVIGRRYPIEKLRGHLGGLSWPFDGDSADEAATAIMTTDTHPKVAEATIGDGPARVVGIAKGVGMIEPDMATLITVLFTDAEVARVDLEACFRRAIDRTFNAVSVDTDTSTSDTAVVLASGAAGPVALDALEAALGDVALALTKMVARDGEGATKLLVVTVDGARDDAQAKRVAKAIVNSPLVKTAVHGADPNWGRVAMAVGKTPDCDDVDSERVVIRFGDQELYPAVVDDAEGLARLAGYLRGEEVVIHVSLGISSGAFTVYGCDLSDQYVRINADYTT